MHATTAFVAAFAVTAAGAVAVLFLVRAGAAAGRQQRVPAGRSLFARLAR